MLVTTIGVGLGSGVGIGSTGVTIGSTGVIELSEDYCRDHPASDAILSECSIVTRPFSPQAMTDQSFLRGETEMFNSRFRDLGTPASKV